MIISSAPPLISLLDKYQEVRAQTLNICSPLSPEDTVVQPITDVSPPKWHMAHTTWFFEQFVLGEFLPDYTVFHSQFAYLFNSYYEHAGERMLRANRGNITRPTVEEVKGFRAYVDEHMAKLIQREDLMTDEAHRIIELGLQHEQQHQELLIYDIKYILGHNPMFPAYHEVPVGNHEKPVAPANFLPIEEGVYQIGYDGEEFHFDNEVGIHRVFLESFAIMDRLVTNGEYLEFVKAGGYRQFQYWLSEAWEWVKREDVKAPLYWHQDKDGTWFQYSLTGLNPLKLREPVTHISFYEAEAFARWKGLRLPTEFEWEVACKLHQERPHEQANFMDSAKYHPQPIVAGNPQFWGDVWEWTQSAYLPYPGYTTEEGALGEYNGKWMVNQKVLRGGSCASPANHVRATYRNFFHPHLRWMFSGIRLAKHL
ncbi:MAG: ergothioneine biosynthesis protein EgtB [Bacteroidota bacterium]